MQQLRYVVAVAEEASFTAAAHRLHVAQPSVSSQIRALERELGAALFTRGHRRVTATPAGQVFLPWARQALGACESGRSAVRELFGLQRGRLAVGATPSLATGLLPTVLALFHARHPGIDLVLRQSGSRELVAGLDQRLLDLALVILPVALAGVDAVALAEEELVVAVPSTHRLAARNWIRPRDLYGEPLIMFRDGYDLHDATLALCRSAGFEPMVAAAGAEMDGVLALAAGGLGAAVVPVSVLDLPGTLRPVRFASGLPRRTLGLAFGQDRPLPPAAPAFAECLRETLAAGWPGGQRSGLTLLTDEAGWNRFSGQPAR